MSETYEIHVKGRLSPTILSAFDDLDASVVPVKTVLSGPVQDQSELHGILKRLQGFGLELVEVRRVPTRAARPSDARAVAG